MGTLHALESADELGSFAIALTAEVEAERDPVQRAWLLLDLALATSLGALQDQHELTLQRLLREPCVPEQCRAVAHAWSGATKFSRGELTGALFHQEEALKLFKSFGDFTRETIAGVRVGGSYIRVGRLTEGVAILKFYAERSEAGGSHDLASLARTEAIEGLLDGDDVLGARALLDAFDSGEAGRFRNSVWGALLSRYCRLAINFRNPSLVPQARREALRFFTELQMPSVPGGIVPRLAAETAFMLARFGGEDVGAAFRWVELGLQMAGAAQLEDRERLTGAGRRLAATLAGE
jgi:hypothetical protein